MARQGAVISTWGTPVRGREGKALEVFMELMGFWAQKAAEGRCEQPEAYFATDGSHGVFVVRGSLDSLIEIQQSDEGQLLLDKGQMIVEELKSHWYFSGDEEIQRGTQLFVQAGTELGFM
jgi:hypothetical protein